MIFCRSLVQLRDAISSLLPHVKENIVLANGLYHLDEHFKSIKPKKDSIFSVRPESKHLVKIRVSFCSPDLFDVDKTCHCDISLPLFDIEKGRHVLRIKQGPGPIK
jgi:hypothetical protein